MRVYVVSCGMYTVEGAAELNLFVRGMKEHECAFLYVWCHTTKSVSAWKHCAAEQQHSTVTNLECHVSFRHCWLLPPLSFSSHASQKLPGRENETERCWSQKTGLRAKKKRERRVSDSLQPVHPTPAEAGLHPLPLLPDTHVHSLYACTSIIPLNKNQRMITISKVAATLKTTIDYVCFPRCT